MKSPGGRLAEVLADRYRIERELGQGGMATVYLAEDLKHDRKVAIKVLKPELAAVLGAERFVQEIKTTAALSHPHILPLFDSGEAGGFLYYVMPFIEGETIREKLNRETQFGIEEAVRITTEVADALDYAHRHGVIHRDIKPENILLHDGRAIVMDFGIALAVSAAAGGRMTETGLSLGTPHYMSPEQATADKTITARSDIYSLASVLYEMLTGEPPHTGGSAQAIIMKIIADASRPVTELRKAVPPNVAAALGKALEKLPADRFDTVKAFANALGDRSFRHGAAPGSELVALASRSRYRDPVFLTVSAVAILGIALAAWGWLKRGTSTAPTAWASSVVLPDTAPLGFGFDIARDGSALVYSVGSAVDPMAWNGFGQGPLRLRRAGEASVVTIPGSAGGKLPRISPDGKRVLYVTPGSAIDVVPLEGGSPVSVGSTTFGLPATWVDDDHIVLGGSRGLAIVPAGGGAVKTVPITMERLVFLEPLDVLPHRAGFVVALHLAGGVFSLDSTQIAVVGADGGTPTILTRGIGARYSATGHVVVTRSDGSIVAIPFDAQRRGVTGPGTPLASGIEIDPQSAAGMIAVSSGGRVVYAASGGALGAAEVVRVARNGRVTPIDSTWIQRFGSVAVSPDGRRIAVTAAGGLESTRGQGARSGIDLLIRDVVSSSVVRVAIPASAVFGPAFEPGGASLVFGVFGNRSGLWRVRADGGSPTSIWQRARAAEPAGSRRDSTAAMPGVIVTSAVTPDRRTAYIGETQPVAGGFSNVRAVRLDSVDATGRLVLIRATAPAPSPDARWLAYLSNATGSWEVKVRSMDPSRDEEWQVAPGARAGSVVHWSSDGRELYYIAGDSLYAAQCNGTAATFSVVSQRALFAARGYQGSFDVTSDGTFIMIRPAPGSLGPTELRMIEDLRAVVGR